LIYVFFFFPLFLCNVKLCATFLFVLWCASIWCLQLIMEIGELFVALGMIVFFIETLQQIGRR
jgi:hypothetical protein